MTESTPIAEIISFGARRSQRRISVGTAINALLVSAGLTLFFGTIALTGIFIGMVVRAIVI
jgi:hypothetical protein